ncbi:condensation protein [Dactylosporangium aurantiacum]|uniref:Condensation protein n=1 Tax=Dactylosporangium aurantiacum TaxID=35754 RepID=A0A9Q9I9K6_9ACTN|nr:condensation domain-containing protein [Dactylosporangium aurantiacum]MDG6105184.1 condensation domain-containing protein [Dactylosporangium aurantiacum]UWZ51706.1 condensation protein [Dactylosporangium aurantiacum]
MGIRTSRILVPFHGEGSGVAELTWAQLGIWQTMRDTGLSMNIGGTVPMPPGTTVQGMEMLLRYLVGRHQALRTRLRFDPDATRQVVSAEGELTLEVLDTDDDPAAAAEQLRSRYERTPFDYEHEWPVRMGVVRHGGEVTHVVVLYCHVAVDGSGIDAIVRDMANLDPETGTTTAPVSGLTPLELAAKQATPAGRRQSEKSLRYWEQLLRSIPAQRFGVSDDPRRPRYWEVTRRSPAMHLAMQLVAHRTGAGVGYVVLAAYSVALARLTGRSPSVAQLVVSNRFRPGCADSVSQLAQLAICAVDVADATFDEVVARAWTAATNAYMHGHFDPLALTAMLERVRADRGDVDFSIIVNDRRTRDGAPPPADLATPQQLRAALPRSTSWWNRKVDVLDAELNISVDAAPDAVDVSICADTHRLGPAEIEALAQEMERVTVEAAFDPAAPTRVGAPIAAGG